MEKLVDAYSYAFFWSGDDSSSMVEAARLERPELEPVACFYIAPNHFIPHHHGTLHLLPSFDDPRTSPPFKFFGDLCWRLVDAARIFDGHKYNSRDIPARRP